MVVSNMPAAPEPMQASRSVAGMAPVALLFDEEMMQFTMGNCIVLEDNNANIKLYKNRHDRKIDSVAALMDAYVAYKANYDMFF